MKLSAHLKNSVKAILARRGWRLQKLGEDEKKYASASYDSTVPLPDGAESYLRSNNPKLVQLRDTYRNLAWPVCSHTVWADERLQQDLSLAWFRGDNAYVWQFRQLMSEARLKMYLMLRYAEDHDANGLLQKLDEDGSFGCWTFRYGSRAPVSRDLVESVIELNFLNRHMGLLGIKDLKILDIGAGYGRLAYRTSEAAKQLAAYDCVDAIPESTFICDYYLRHRKVDKKARAIPLQDVPDTLTPGTYHIAFNIHSFSECTFAAVEWWFSQIRRLRIPWLLIVPNHPEELLTYEKDGTTRDYSPLIEAAGYELAAKELVYNSPEIQQLVGVRDHFFLFKLRE